jgi:hypothetical protein
MSRGVPCPEPSASPFRSCERPKRMETVHRLKVRTKKGTDNGRVHELQMCANHVSGCFLKYSERECAIVQPVCSVGCKSR